MIVVRLFREPQPINNFLEQFLIKIIFYEKIQKQRVKIQQQKW